MNKFTISGRVNSQIGSDRIVINPGIELPPEFGADKLEEQALDHLAETHVLAHVCVPSSGDCSIEVFADTHDHVTELFRIRRMGRGGHPFDEVLYMAEAGAQIRIRISEHWEDCHDATNWSELVALGDDLEPTRVPLSITA